MEADRWQQIRELFEEVRQRPVESQASFLKGIDDSDVRRAVERLLEHHSPEFLEEPVFRRQAPGDDPEGEFPTILEGEAPPATNALGGVPQFRVLEVIGEGGMGIVYLAEQVRPVRRRVALKVIKQGMSSKEIVARFEAERQALALMNHPNIARVHDAGTTGDSRPYFAMEFVPGLPLIEYCDRHQLNLRERLLLFRDICMGLHHAHLRGIIHRDVKPSNVLVTCPDATPIAKIIDFGVAKSTNVRLTEKTLHTQFGRAVGTPAYMSPEQAEMTTEDVDHLSDIYSAGVLLYELLVGKLPYDWQPLSKIPFDEVLRQIREVEPPSPSTRWSRLDHDQTTLSAQSRKTTPRIVQRHLKGDIDWITMKCLEKSRKRRYPTAAHLAADIERYLKGEPTLAGPPTLVYRTRKFVRRNRGPVTAAAVIFLLLAAGLVATFLQYRRAEEQRERVLRLSDWKRIEDLVDDSDRLWPPSHDKIAALEAWLVDARELVERIDEHRTTIDELRSLARDGRRGTGRDGRREHESSSGDDVELSRMRQVRESMKDLLSGPRAAKESVTNLSFRPDFEPERASYRFRRRFPVEGARAVSGIVVRIQADDGAVVFINGEEPLPRRNVPDGPLTPQTRASERLSGVDQEMYHELRGPADDLVDGANVISVAVYQAQRGGSDLRFDLSLAIISSDGGETELVARGSVWRYDSRPERPDDDWHEARDLPGWPSAKAPFGYGFSRGLGWAEEKLSELEEQIVARESRLSPPRWMFEDKETDWWHGTLVDLLDQLAENDEPGSFRATMAGVEKRLEFARTVRRLTIDERDADWAEVIEAIANDDRYGGLRIKPLEGLVPLGRDPGSRLFEFAHVQSGAIPARGDDGKLRISGDTGIVLVLLPSGTFSMGAVRPQPGLRPETPVDPSAQDDEHPVHEVTVSAFFISKYEMTQGQWRRATGENPSAYGKPMGPVEQVTRERCREVLERLALSLPTEAQWEYATRAETRTPWSSGPSLESLRQVANLADARFWKSVRGKRELPHEEWDDGHTMTAPVGSYLPNQFGLHDVHGNVAEWCLDEHGPYDMPVSRGSAARLLPPGRRDLTRGGSYYHPATRARSAARSPIVSGFFYNYIGVRPVRTLELESR